MVNSWLDIMNSYTPSESIPTKKPYGINLEMQDDILNKMTATIGEMNCIGKKTQQVFQKGIVITRRSIQGLFHSLKQEFQMSYIITHRPNQDCLQNFLR